MFFARFKKSNPKDAFSKALAYELERIEKTKGFILEAKKKDDSKLVLQNYSFLIGHMAHRAIMTWRQGNSPQAEIKQLHQSYLEATSYRMDKDLDKLLLMEEINGITDWDMAYTLFWLSGVNEVPFYHHDGFPDNRYFFYNRYLVSELLGLSLSSKVHKQAKALYTQNHDPVDKNFVTKLKLLGIIECSESTDSLVQEAEQAWLKRKKSRYYMSNAPEMSGYEETNELSLDYLLSAILKNIDWDKRSIHSWP